MNVHHEQANQGGFHDRYNAYQDRGYGAPHPEMQPPHEVRDIHPSTNFYRTEMEAAQPSVLPNAGLTDEQILNQVD